MVVVVSSEEEGKNPIRKLLGLGFWVQGLRCYPLMAVNFFLKDELKVNPSTLQLLQNSANLPMVGKPLYGVVSDAVYIRGQHRVPYIAIGVFLQAVSWLAIAILPTSSISVFTITAYLLLSNLGASIVEVANDAIVAETGKQTTPSSKNSESSSSGELQSFVWIASSLGGVLGNVLGGVTIDRITPQTMFLFFGLLLSVQFFITNCVRESSLNLSKSCQYNAGIRKQLSDLSSALQKPKIAYSIAWLAASDAIIPSLMGTMFYYQTTHLKIDATVLGISKVFDQAAMVLWSVVYNRRLKSVSPRKLISAIQAALAVSMLSDVLFVKGFYRGMGMPDSVYVVIFSGLSEALFHFKILPLSVLIAQLCPAGCEGSVMAFLMSGSSLAYIVSGYFGVALVKYMGVTGDNLSGFPRAIIIQAVCTVLPLFWTSYIPDQVESKAKRKSY